MAKKKAVVLYRLEDEKKTVSPLINDTERFLICSSCKSKGSYMCDSCGVNNQDDLI